MFIAVVGTRCSGKSTVQKYLVSKGFIPVRLTVKSTDSGLSTLCGKGFDGCPSDGSLDSSSIPAASPHTSTTAIVFTCPRQLLDYVTRHWRSKFVTVDLTSVELVGIFAKRPFFMLVNVAAPLLQRFRRLASRSASLSDPQNKSDQNEVWPSSFSLEDFVRLDDECVFGTDVDNPTSEHLLSSGLHGMLPYIKLSVINTFRTVTDLIGHLNSLDITSAERLRPRWDTYFMTLADLASQRSNCMKRKVGAILVRENRIVATGYNGTPRGVKNCNEGGCAHCNGTSVATGTDCLCLHAEENALLEAGRDRVGPNAILYCNTCPCLKCSIKIIQCGVEEVVYHLSYKVDEASAKLFQEAGVRIRRHIPATIA